MSPLLLVGTQEDAKHLGDTFSNDPHEAARLMRAEKQRTVVPSPAVAANVLRLLGYEEEWVQAHVLMDWSFD